MSELRTTSERERITSRRERQIGWILLVLAIAATAIAWSGVPLRTLLSSLHLPR